MEFLMNLIPEYMPDWVPDFVYQIGPFLHNAVVFLVGYVICLAWICVVFGFFHMLKEILK